MMALRFIARINRISGFMFFKKYGVEMHPQKIIWNQETQSNKLLKILMAKQCHELFN